MQPRRRHRLRAVAKASVAVVVMFLTAGFVLPGVFSAIVGGPVPAPTMMNSWGSWLLMWACVSVVVQVSAQVIFLLIERKKVGGSE